MPYSPAFSAKSLSVDYPVADSVLNCTDTEYNITYVIPECSNGCLILTRIVQSGFFVLTSYLPADGSSAFAVPTDEGSNFTLPNALLKAFVRFYVKHYERNHCLAMHRRNAPFATHSHYGLHQNIDLQVINVITPLLRQILLSLPPSTSKSKSIKQFYKAVKFFIRNPTEPGIYFENGHYALKDGYNTESAYPHGPYKLKKNRFSFFRR
ncbi:hypothetical protein [Endozoicomonas euniceicola]|uniref:Uncharacterized protein n=1 Tax=Endozoicomonas euniceicola TaxID=1234143 RepID=A0ABY6GRW4_9GAMM|nr:hypothetical protein [Endozoicomonas euniceicola]UYM15159.1 hypothetical protein NX720_20185 [Endozoicomonas euniceicola]